MNFFFINKVKKLRSSLPPPRNDPLEHLRNLMSTRTCAFTLKPVHPDDVLEIVKNLKNSKSTGLDNLDVWTLKLIIGDILPALTHVINLSLTSLVFPNVWKLAKIIPLLKKGDPLCPENYRPVDQLSILSKILERWSSSRWWSIWRATVYYTQVTMVQEPSTVLVQLLLRCMTLGQSV